MGDIISGVIGGAGSLLGGNKQTAADSSAANQSLTGFNYLTGGNGVGGYINAGSAANNQAAELLGVGGNGGGGGNYNAFASGGGGNPGTAAAMGTALQAHGSNLAGAASGATAGAAFGPWGAAIGGALGGLASQFSKKNNSPLQDIHQALAAGKPVSDASWAQAGFGPGGSALGGGNGGAPGSANGSPGNANGPTGSAFGNYLNSTGYKFQLQQGQNAITGNAAARGLLGSGGTAKALTRYGTGLAAQNFDNYLGQLGNVANRGIQAGGIIGQAGTAGGGNAARFTQAGGQAAAGQIGDLAGSAQKIGTGLVNYFGSGSGGGNSGGAYMNGGNWIPGAQGF